MKPQRAPSLQGRVVALVLGAVVAVWLLTVIAGASKARHEMDELLDSHLAQAAAVLVAQQVQALGEAANEHEGERSTGAPQGGRDGRDGHDGREGQDGRDGRNGQTGRAGHASPSRSPGSAQARSLHRYAPKVAFQVWHEGALLLRSAQAPETPMSAAGLNGEDGFATFSWGGQRWRVFATRGAESDIRVFVAEEMGARQEILWALLAGLAAPWAVALPMLALAAWWAVRQGMAPLRSVGRDLAARRADALTPLSASGAPREMQPLLQALNDLFQRIATLLESERRFTADAAHELRTPIAAIRTQAQVALGATEAAERRHALEATLAGCDRATRLVDQLLTLARLESAQAPAPAAVDLGQLARRVVADMAPQAMDHQQSLAALEGGTGLDTHSSSRAASTPTSDFAADAGTVSLPYAVLGHADLLQVLLRNLLDNAMRYAGPGANIEITLQRIGTAVQLSVEDSGPGMTDSDRSRLGERFFRVLGTTASGSGLGWSIVRRVAAAHHIDVQVARSERLGGLAVHLCWPQQAPG